MSGVEDKLDDLIKKVKDPAGIVLMERLQIIIDIVLDHQTCGDERMNKTLINIFSRLQYAREHCTNNDAKDALTKMYLLKKTVNDIIEEIKAIQRLI